MDEMNRLVTHLWLVLPVVLPACKNLPSLSGGQKADIVFALGSRNGFSSPLIQTLKPACPALEFQGLGFALNGAHRRTLSALAKDWSKDKKRYLNGEATYQVELNEAGVDARIVDVKVPGKTVAEGFIAGIGTWTLLAPYQKIEPTGSALKRVKKATVTPEGITLSSQE